jgi:hypothetical protein
VPVWDLPVKRAPALSFALVAALGVSARPAFARGPTLPQCLAANESAIKLRVDHKLRQAREASLVCASAACPGEVRDACEKRAAQVSAVIPMVVFDVTDASGNLVTVASVTMDRLPLAERLDGSPLAVDPGEHVLSFSAPGQPTLEKRFVFEEGVIGRHESVVLGAAATLPASVAIEPQPTATRSSSGLGTRKLAGLAVGGVGVAGVAVGSIFGIMTFASWSAAGSACGSGGTSHCSRASAATVTSDHSAAETDGTISTVAFVAGGALLATGVALFVTGASHEHTGRPTAVLAPAVGPGQAGLSLGGSF